MSNKLIKKQKQRRRTILRVRKKISGTNESPRLHISKTNKHLYAQIINDVNGNVLFGISTASEIFKKSNEGVIGGRNKKSAAIMGGIIGNFIASSSLSKCQFDRRWAKYHGILSVFADEVRAIANVF